MPPPNSAPPLSSRGRSAVPGISGPAVGSTRFFAQLGRVKSDATDTDMNALNTRSFTIMGAASYLLVSAGADGKYFTDDDLVVAK